MRHVPLGDWRKLLNVQFLRLNVRYLCRRRGHYRILGIFDVATVWLIAEFATQVPGTAIAIINIHFAVVFFIIGAYLLNGSGFNVLKPLPKSPAGEGAGKCGHWLNCDYCGALHPLGQKRDTCDWYRKESSVQQVTLCAVAGIDLSYCSARDMERT